MVLFDNNTLNLSNDRSDAVQSKLLSTPELIVNAIYDKRQN